MRAGLGGLLCLALAACAGAPAVPADRYHRLETSENAAPSAAALPQLTVFPYEGSGIYVERPLLYIDARSGETLQQYRYDFWAKPVLQMLEEALIDDLRAAAGPERVFTRSARVPAERLIRPRLRQLEHRLDSGAGQAHLALDFEVLDADRGPLFVMAFDESEPCATQGAAAYVDAVGRLTNEAHGRLLERLRAVR